MNWQQRFHRLNLDDYRILNQQIDSIATIQRDALIEYRCGQLPLELQSPLAQFLTETFLVNRFQQARPEMPMNFDSTADDPVGYFVFHSASQRLCVKKNSR